MDQVLEAYELVSSGIQVGEAGYEESRKLLTLASETSGSSHPSFINQSLNGQHYSTRRLEIVINDPGFVCTESTENLTRLYALFGRNFLIQVLHQYSINQGEIFGQFLRCVVDKMPVKDIGALYQFINTQVAKNTRLPLFNHLGVVLSDDQTAELFDKEPFRWVILVAKPTMISTLSQEQLQQLIQTPLTANDFQYAASLCANPLFNSFSRQIYHLLFNLFLSTPTLVTDEEDLLIETMRARPETPARCLAEINTLRAKLLSVVKDNAHPFTSERYQNIYDAYRNHKSSSDVLRAMNIEKTDYPQGNYELQSFIICELFNDDPLLDLLGCLEAIHPAENYTSYTEADIKRAKYSTLCECLLILRDKHLLQENIINLLDTIFQDDDWKNELSYYGKRLLDKALLNGDLSLLQYYFPPDMEDEQRIAQLQFINKRMYDETNHLLLQSVIDNPHALRVVLSLCPPNYYFTAVTERDSFGDTVLHTTAAKSNMIACQTILNILHQDHRFHAINQKNNEGNTVLHIAANEGGNPQELNIILDALPINKRFQAVNEPDSNGFTTLQLLSDNPAALCVILKALPPKHCFEALTQKNDDGDNLLHLACRNVGALRAMLEALPVSLCFDALMVKNIEGNTALHKVARYHPASLKIMLEALPEGQRLKALNEKNSDDYNVFNLASALHLILALIPVSLCIHMSKRVLYLTQGMTSFQLSGKDTSGAYLGHQSVTDIKNIYTMIPDQVTTLILSGQELYRKSAMELLDIFAATPKNVTRLDLSDNLLHQKSSDEFAQYLVAIPETVTSIALNDHRFMSRDAFLSAEMILSSSGFQQHLEHIKSKTLRMKNSTQPNYATATAADIATILYTALEHAQKTFLSSANTQNARTDFVKNCRRAFNNVKGRLQTHGGWKQILDNAADAIASIPSTGVMFGVSARDTFGLFATQKPSGRKSGQAELSPPRLPPS